VPLAFLFDEHLRGPLWHAVQAHNLVGSNPLDVVRVGDPPDLPLGVDDPGVLLWTEREGRILVSNDHSTLPDHLQTHLDAGHHCPGIFLLRRGTSVSRILTYLELAAYASEPSEWENRIEYLDV
jgi:hypothetical protein